MQQNIYAVYDVAAAIYLTTLIVSHNDVQPARQFNDAKEDEKSIFNKHPDDFDLHQIATINLVTGEVTEMHRLVVLGRKPKHDQLDLPPNDP